MSTAAGERGGPPDYTRDFAGRSIASDDQGQLARGTAKEHRQGGAVEHINRADLVGQVHREGNGTSHHALPRRDRSAVRTRGSALAALPYLSSSTDMSSHLLPTLIFCVHPAGAGRCRRRDLVALGGARPTGPSAVQPAAALAPLLRWDARAPGARARRKGGREGAARHSRDAVLRALGAAPGARGGGSSGSPTPAAAGGRAGGGGGGGCGHQLLHVNAEALARCAKIADPALVYASLLFCW